MLEPADTGQNRHAADSPLTCNPKALETEDSKNNARDGGRGGGGSRKRGDTPIMHVLQA